MYEELQRKTRPKPPRAPGKEKDKVLNHCTYLYG